MKELSIEQKAQRYDEAIEKAKDFYKGYKQRDNQLYADDLESIFPELHKSEDEKIREELIGYFTGWSDKHLFRGFKAEQVLAWLEKQNSNVDNANKEYWRGYREGKKEILDKYSEHANFLKNIQIGDKVTRNEGGVLVNLSQLERVAKPRRTKPADKVEPNFNFKVGQWIVATGKCVYLIAKIDGFNVTLVDTNDDEYVFDASSLDDAHEWTVSDAKDGDVLAYKTDEGDLWIMIYWSLYEPYEGHVHYHAILVNDDFGDKGTCYICIDHLKPATKEQRDFLFQKMKEDGYEWDAEKKELKKIEHKHAELGENKSKELSLSLQIQAYLNTASDELYAKGKPLYSEERIKDIHKCMLMWQKIHNAYFYQKTAWSKEDERIYQSIMDDTVQENQLNDEQTNWLKDIKYRYFQQPKSEWSEEDEKTWKELIEEVKDQLNCVPAPDCRDKEDEKVLKQLNKWLTWLKSLRPQKQWKPSKKQLETFEYYLDTDISNKDKEVLFGLYGQLKQL